jgi:hypothetical protein
MLDGFVVNIGDTVWDVLLAAVGTVTATPGGGMFTVDFQNGRVLTYTTGGLLAGARRAYWLNPVLTLPEKADPQWSLLQNVVGAIRSS